MTAATGMLLVAHQGQRNMRLLRYLPTACFGLSLFWVAVATVTLLGAAFAKLAGFCLWVIDAMTGSELLHTRFAHMASVAAEHTTALLEPSFYLAAIFFLWAVGVTIAVFVIWATLAGPIERLVSRREIHF